jgi:hypothetical protein
VTGWIDRQRRTVAEVADALGRGGDPRRGYPCPACGEATRDGRRGAVVVGPNGGWHCYRCAAVGDGLDYLSYALNGHRLREATPEQRSAVRDWCGEAPAPLPSRPVAPPRYADVSSFWSACYPCPSGDPFLTERRLVNVPPHLARFTPPVNPAAPDLFPAWWPRGRADTWRLVTRGWSFAAREDGAGDAEGPAPHAVNLHGRAVVEPPEFEGRRIKTLWGRGLDARGLLFWNKRPTLDAQLVVVAEGITDWLAFACWADSRPGVVVLGLTSGGDSAFTGAIGPAHPLHVPATADLILATDDDPAGDAYAARIASHYRHRRVNRVHPARFLPHRLAAK